MDSVLRAFRVAEQELLAAMNQARSKPILIGQAILHMSSRGVWGHAPPEKF